MLRRYGRGRDNHLAGQLGHHHPGRSGHGCRARPHRPAALVHHRCPAREYAGRRCGHDRGEIGPWITRRIAQQQADVATGQAGQRAPRAHAQVHAGDLLHDPTGALGFTGCGGNRDEQCRIQAHQRSVPRRVLPRRDEHAVGDRKPSGTEQELAAEVAQLEPGIGRRVQGDAAHRGKRGVATGASTGTQKGDNRGVSGQRGDSCAALPGLEEIGEDLGREWESLVGERS